MLRNLLAAVWSRTSTEVEVLCQIRLIRTASAVAVVEQDTLWAEGLRAARSALARGSTPVLRDDIRIALLVASSGLALSCSYGRGAGVEVRRDGVLWVIYTLSLAIIAPPEIGSG